MIFNPSKETIYNNLPFWNKTGKEFKIVIGDPERTENPEIRNINDINKGAIHNALYWHIRWQDRCRYEIQLDKATGFLLEEWGKIVDIPKPYPMTDAEYSGYIIQYILSGVVSLPIVRQIFEGYNIAWKQYPPFLDLMFLDVGIMDKTNPNYYKCAVITHKTNAVYVYMDEFGNFTQLMKGKVQHTAAGTGIYIGIY